MWMDGAEPEAAKLCLVDTCEELARTRGRCGRHYRAWLYSDEGQAAKRQIYMTDKEIIDWLHASVGGSKAGRLRPNRTKPMYEWNLSRQADVREFLTAIAPYLRVHTKQRKAREALTEIAAKAAAKEAKRRAGDEKRTIQR